MGYNLPHHLEYNLQTDHFEVSNNVRDVTFISGSLAVVATDYGIEAFPYDQSENYGYITVLGGFNRIDHAYNNIYAYSSTSGTIYRTTVEELRNANGSSASLVEVYPLRDISNWVNTISENVKFNYNGTNTITISGGECIIIDNSPETDKAFVSYDRELKPPFSIKSRIKITDIDYNGHCVADSLLSINHSVTGINTSTQGSLIASFYIYVQNSTSARIGLYYNDGINDWYWKNGDDEWGAGSYSLPFNYNVYNTFYTVELVVTVDYKITFSIYNSSETLLESISTTDDHAAGGFNLVTNGAFSSSTSDWTAENGATLDSVLKPVDVGFCLRITGDGEANPKATQNIELVAGRIYTISYQVLQGSERTFQIYVEIDSEQYGFVSGEAGSSWNPRTSIFISPITGYGKLNLIQISSAGEGKTIYFDDIGVTADAKETILSTDTLWGWSGDNRSSDWATSNTSYCIYNSDYFNVYPYWAAYEPVINDFDLVNIGSDTYLGVACADDRAGKTGRAIIIKNEDEANFERLADCQTVVEDSYDPRLIRFADGDVYYQLGTGSNSRLYGIMDFWTKGVSPHQNVQFNPETGLIFNSTLNDLAVYYGTSYDGLGNSIFTATDDGAVVIYQHRTDLFNRNYFSLGHENIIMHDSFIDYDIGYAPECWISTVNDSTNQSIRVLYDTGDYYYGANDIIGGITQVDKATLTVVRSIVTTPANKGCESIAVDDQFVWVSYSDSSGQSTNIGVVRHVKNSTDYDIALISEWSSSSSSIDIEGTLGVDETHVYVVPGNHYNLGGGTSYPSLVKIDKFSLDYEVFSLTGSGIPSGAGASSANHHFGRGVAVDADYVYILDWCYIGTWNDGPHLIRWNKNTEVVDKVIPNIGDAGSVDTTCNYLYLDDTYLYFSWGYQRSGSIRRMNKNMESTTMESAGGGGRDICVGENIVHAGPVSTYTYGGTQYHIAYFVEKDTWGSVLYYYRVLSETHALFAIAFTGFYNISMDSNALYASRQGYFGQGPENLRVDPLFVETKTTGGAPLAFTADAILYSTITFPLFTIGDMTGFDYERTFGSVSKNKVLEMLDLSTSTNINFKRHFKDIAVNDNYTIKFKSRLKREEPFYMALRYNGNTALEFKWDTDGTVNKKVAPCSGTSWAGFSIASGTYTKSTWAEYKIEAFVSSNTFNFYIDDVQYETSLSGSFCNDVFSLNEIVFYTDSSTKQLAYLDGVTIYDYNEVAEDYTTEIDYPVFHGITNKSKSVVKTSSFNHGNPEVIVHNYDPVFGGSISQINLDVTNAFGTGICLYAYYSTAAPMGPEQVDINRTGIYNKTEGFGPPTADRLWVCGNFGMNIFSKWDSKFHVESIHVNDLSYNYYNKIIACATKGGVDILSLNYEGLRTKSHVTFPNGCSTIFNSDRGIYFTTACSGVLFLSDANYPSYFEGEEISSIVEKKFNVEDRNLSNNLINCIHLTNDGIDLLVSTESGVDFITFTADSSYVPTEYAQYGFHIPQGSDKCFVTPKGSCYYNVRGEGLAVNYEPPSTSGTLYNDIEVQIDTGGDQDLTIGKGIHIKYQGNIWNDYMKGQRVFIEHTGLIHKVEAYVKRVGNPDPLRCSIYSAVDDGYNPSTEQVYTEVSGIDTSYSWVEFNLPYYKVFASDPGEGDYNLVWAMFTQEKMDWNNYYVIKSTTNMVYTPFSEYGFGTGYAVGGQGNIFQTDSGTGFLLASGTWGTASAAYTGWSQIYTKTYLSDRWNTEGLWNSWDHIYTTSGTPALISSNINDIYIYEGASDYSTNQNWNKIYLATDSGVQIIDERRSDITLSKSTTVGLEGGSYDYNLMKGVTYNSTAVWNLEEEGNFYIGTNDGFEGGAFNAMNFTDPVYLQDFLTTEEGGGYIPELDLYSNNINDLEVIYLSGLRALTI